MQVIRCRILFPLLQQLHQWVDMPLMRKRREFGCLCMMRMSKSRAPNLGYPSIRKTNRYIPLHHTAKGRGMFKALVIDNTGGTTSTSIQNLDDARLPAGSVTVAVEYSTVNYKDGLVVTGAGGLVKQYPHVPGVDFAGTVTESGDPTFKPGDKVILTGWRVGEVRWGGLSQKATANAEWLVPLPSGLTTLQAMAIGTAGFTAMLAVITLEAHGLTPKSGEVLVTGAAGGGGSG